MGNIDFSEIRDFQKKMEKELSQEQISKFIEDCVKHLNLVFLQKVIKKTPVGIYKNKMGGTLRRGWILKDGTGAVSDGEIRAFVNSVIVQKKGNQYIVYVNNNVEYASYVEDGHITKKRNKETGEVEEGYVEGQFFMKKSEDEVDANSVSLLTKLLEKKLKGVIK